MKLNIELVLTDEQFERIKETGELSIKVTLDDEGSSICEESQWPDTRGNKDAELIIQTAKHYGLSPSELTQLSRSRVKNILDDYSLDYHQNMERVLEVERCLGIKFVGIMWPGESHLSEVFSTHVTKVLSNWEGITTLTDLKTITMERLGKIRGLGVRSIHEIESVLKR